MSTPTARDESRNQTIGENTWQSLNAGSLQRIADAVEKMAQNWMVLESERNRYKQSAEFRMTRIETLERANAALRGVITKLKRQPK